MPRLILDVPDEIAEQLERLVKEGWYSDQHAAVQSALGTFLVSKSYLGDSPRLLLRFAADALNESKPETAIRFADRGLSLLAVQEHPDRAIYQSLIEIRLQALLVLGRQEEALETVERAKEILPNHPGITAWQERLRGREEG